MISAVVHRFSVVLFYDFCLPLTTQAKDVISKILWG